MAFTAPPYHGILLNPWTICNFVARIRITKAAEFFKAVIPGMDPNMDKATAFHLTVYYMVFLRNALRQQDPAIIPKLHEVRDGYARDFFMIFAL